MTDPLDVVKIVAGPFEVPVETVQRTSPNQPTWLWLPDAKHVKAAKAMLGLTK